MSDEPTTGGTVWDDPNRQAVGLDPAWVEGTGGEPGEVTPVADERDETDAAELDAMTKDELLAYGQSLGITPMNAGMSKDEIRAAIDAHQA